MNGRKNSMTDTNDYRHFIWKRHSELSAWDEALPEVLTTDGIHVRRARSYADRITFQEFSARLTAQTIKKRIENCVSNGSALMGYSMFSDIDVLAIFQTGTTDASSWVAMPYSKSSKQSFPTMPIQLVEKPFLVLTATARLERAERRYQIQATLRQDGAKFWESGGEIDLLQSIESIRLKAQVRGNERKKIRLCRTSEAQGTRRVGDHLKMTFDVDDAMLHTFGADPGLSTWLVIDFSPSLLCLPTEWRRFWMSAKLDLDSIR